MVGVVGERSRVEAWAEALGVRAVRCGRCGGWTVAGQGAARGVYVDRVRCSECRS